MRYIHAKLGEQFPTDCLHILVLASFAFAQPLYEMLGKNPELFVAHRTAPHQIILVVLVLSFGIALLLSLLELASAALAKPVQSTVHQLLVLLLFALIAAPPVKQWLAGSSDLKILAAIIILAMTSTVAYAGLSLLRLFITALAPAVLVFPLLFVFNTPVLRLVLPESADSSVESELKIGKQVPIVIVILDELSLVSLLDASGQLDAVRYPNLSLIAAESTWFPNAIAASNSTVEVIPSILSGRFPNQEKLLMPTYADHPVNLFSLLDRHYSMNISEPVTSLFSRGQPNKAISLLLSDMSVLYLHLVIPPYLSGQLPSMDGRWSGFAGNISQDETTAKREQWDSFIANTDANGKAQLNFLHVLMPHTPQQHLASGHQYTMSKRQPDGLISNAVGWGDSESLLITGYSRYIQQIAYVDSLLGKLREQLIESGNYDESLVIISADHGVAYQRGQSRRDIDEGNVNEILNVPLLLKLPRQAQGEINERVVSSVDILPTILDILDADTQLEFDGSSMYSQQDPLTVIDIPRAGELSTDSILQRTQLDWQIENFGENTPLGKLVPKGPFHGLANRSIDDLTIGDSVGLSIPSGDFMAFESVDKASGFIPALFSGHIEGAGGKKFAVAIALNGKIVATTNTSEWQGQKNYFSVLLPSDAFVDGRNLVKAYQILGSEAKPTLHAFQGGVLDVSLQLGKTGPDSLIFRGKELVALEQNRSNMNGYSDNVAMENGMIRFAGWAADLADQLPASYILIFRGEQLVWQIVPQVERNAVAEKFGTGLLLSGYSALVPPSTLQSKSGDISLIAVSGEKRAFRLHLRPEAVAFLEKTLD